MNLNTSPPATGLKQHEHRNQETRKEREAEAKRLDFLKATLQQKRARLVDQGPQAA
jgi:hypothetical protein